MEIRKSALTDFDVMVKIYDYAREFMAKVGNPIQWGDGYPKKDMLINDIKLGQSYVCVDGEEVVAVFVFIIGEDPTYRIIKDGQWLNDLPYGVIHRIAVMEGQKGVASFCLKWAMEQCHNIKIDTHGDNIPMQKALVKLGYTVCGTIFVDDGSARIAYQLSDL